MGPNQQQMYQTAICEIPVVGLLVSTRASYVHKRAVIELTIFAQLGVSVKNAHVLAHMLYAGPEDLSAACTRNAMQHLALRKLPTRTTFISKALH